MSKSDCIIELKDVSRIYKLGNIHISALKNINLSIKEGEFVAIKGPSGSGKSTLMHIIGCLDRPSEGEYSLNGRSVEKLDDEQLARIRSHQFGFVFQTFNLLPRMNAIKNTELPLVYANVPPPRRKEAALKMLGSVGLSDRISHLPNELSGGEKQRVAISRALVNNPKIILADEPTGNLDSESGRQILEIFRELNKRGITILLVTHEHEIAEYAKRTIVLKDGEIVKP